MTTFNDEYTIIDYFRNDIKNPFSCYCCFPTESEAAMHALESISLKTNWSKWTDSSGKAMLPPDFFSDDLHLMMEVMRVDDHAFKNKKGKIVNPVLAHESELFAEVKKSGILEALPNAKHIFFNGASPLTTNEYHNYDFYLKNFTRTVNHHKNKVTFYRKNHPNHNLIFFVMDESSAYVQVENKKFVTIERTAGTPFVAQPHCFFPDNAFVDVIIQSCADYLIWYAPFKLMKTKDGILPLPKFCVYDIGSFTIEPIRYNNSLMISCEI